jgi:hypothetical protein
MIYTLCIIVLILISIYLVADNTKLYRSKAFLFWLIISCCFGWTEFYCFLRWGAWIFNPKHITGIFIAGVTIEDILFCPSFSTIFYKLFHWSKFRFRQRVYSPTDKLIFAMFLFGVIVFNFDISSLFGRYMSFRTFVGFGGLLYVWNSSSFRHAAIFMAIVFAIAFCWDLPSVHFGIWTYIKDPKYISIIYDGLYVKIWGALFPVEILSYYISGAAFSFYTIAFLEKYFSCQKKN